jgi:hypothetical protein
MEAQINQIREYFNALTFNEEQHLYFVDGKQLDISVSGLVKKFVEPVDFDSISIAIDKRDGLPLGTTRKLWNGKSGAACAKGDKVHFFGEIYAFHRNIEPRCGQEVAVKKFWDELPDHIVPVFTELKMYHKIAMFGGTADIILFNKKTKKFIIADYKTNEDLFKGYKGKTLLKPFSYKIENDYNKYQIQFSYYQIMFEQTGFEVENRCLIWLKPDGTYLRYFTEDLTETLKLTI